MPDEIRAPAPTIPARRPPKAKEEGVVMLAVMLLLLMCTLTGMVALESSTFELRAVGSERRVLQTHYVAESALSTSFAVVDSLGGDTMRAMMIRSTVPTGTRLATEEPLTNRATTNYRFTLADVPVTLGILGAVIETDTTRGASLGPMLGVVPDFTLDINDDHEVSRPVAGSRADGLGDQHFMIATYTARGRTRPPVDVYDAGDSSPGRRGLHESAANARAFAITPVWGP